MLEESRFAYRHVGSPEQVIVDRSMSVSFVAALPEAERARVEARLRAIIADEPSLAGRETVEMPYETVAYRVERLE